MNIPEVLKEIGAVGSTNEKLRILKENQSATMRRLLRQSYDHFITYGVHKLDISDITFASETHEDWWFEVFKLLDKLEARELTGNAAKAAVKEVMNHASEEFGMIVPQILNKDLRMGAGTRLINKVYPGLLPENFCMSANKYDAKRVSFPVYADSKLDGVRCVAVVSDKTVELFSRNGKEFKNYTTIQDELERLALPLGIKIDGEITSGHFQDLMRSVHRKTDGIELAKDSVYNIFDVPDPEKTFEERMVDLKGLGLSIAELGLTHVKIVTGTLVQNEEELLAFYDSQLKAGQEGIMVKTLDGKYEFRRGWGWQKMKPEESDDLEIIGSVEGLGKYKGQLGVVVCRLENGGEVRVGSGFKDDEREELWKNRESLIGRIAEVKYQEKTKDGSLRFPIFIRFRPDKE